MQYENQATEPTAAAVPAAPAPEWKTITSWTSNKAEKFTTYAASTSDSSITDAVTSKGLVLAFVKNGDKISALPFQEKGANDAYWYYQVSTGTITFSLDSYKGSQNLDAAGFKYFSFSPEQLKDLESKGYSKIKLMQLSYEEVAALY